MEKSKALEISPNEVLAIPDILPTAHEIATILRLGTSYELVDWLVIHIQFAFDQLAQENKNLDIIQRPLPGALGSEEEREL